MVGFYSAYRDGLCLLSADGDVALRTVSLSADRPCGSGLAVAPQTLGASPNPAPTDRGTPRADGYSAMGGEPTSGGGGDHPARLSRTTEAWSQGAACRTQWAGR